MNRAPVLAIVIIYLAIGGLFSAAFVNSLTGEPVDPEHEDGQRLVSIGIEAMASRLGVSVQAVRTAIMLGVAVAWPIGGVLADQGW